MGRFGVDVGSMWGRSRVDRGSGDELGQMKGWSEVDVGPIGDGFADWTPPAPWGQGTETSPGDPSTRYMLPTVAAQLKRASSGADLRLERVSVSTTSLQSPRERSVPNAQRPARQRRRSPTQRHVPPSADEVRGETNPKARSHIDPKSGPHRPQNPPRSVQLDHVIDSKWTQVDHKSTPDGPQMDHRSTTHRPQDDLRIDSRSIQHRPQHRP